MKRSIFLVSLLSTLLFSSSQAEIAERPSSAIKCRFSFVGCNRVDFDVDQDINPSTANVGQLKATFRNLAKLKSKPSHFFFLGDLILGYTSGLDTVEQLQAWRALYEKSRLSRSGVTLVPVVGNHETLLSYKDEAGSWHDYPNPAAIFAWEDVMKPFLDWHDGPQTTAPNDDQLTISQEVLSFTVREHNILFIILNTDTFVDNLTLGDIPLHWLQQKLDEGEADKTVEHIFVMGHKPLSEVEYKTTLVRDGERQNAENMLAANPKVRAYLAAHYHLWDFRRLSSGLLQITAGNGGSKLKGSFKNPEVGYYGYTLLDILESGEMVVESWGRPVPNPYDGKPKETKVTLRERRVVEL